jgi:hypothetical protein
MTPKEKANDLVSKFYNKQTNVNQWGVSDMQKQCALIAVDEILTNTGCNGCKTSEMHYWTKVKQEIEKL